MTPAEQLWNKVLSQATHAERTTVAMQLPGDPQPREYEKVQLTDLEWNAVSRAAGVPPRRLERALKAVGTPEYHRLTALHLIASIVRVGTEQRVLSLSDLDRVLADMKA